MKSILTKMQVLSLLAALPVQAGGLYNSSAQPTRATQPPVVMIAEAAQVQMPIGTQGTLGICRPMENVPNDPVLGKETIDFSAAAVNYLFYYEKQNISESGAKVTLLQSPVHGQMVGGTKGVYSYKPNPDFHGQEKISALVELGGYQVKVVYFIMVVNEDQRVGDDEVSIKKYCGPKGDMWKISLPATTLNLAALQ